jgi:putative transposase
MPRQTNIQIRRGAANDWSSVNPTLSLGEIAMETATRKVKKELVWLRETNAQALQFSLRCLEIAYNGFFSKKTKFPNFKKRHGKQSFTVPQAISLSNGKIKIPR